MRDGSRCFPHFSEDVDAPGAAFAAVGEREGWIALFRTRGPRHERGLVLQVFDQGLRPGIEPVKDGRD